VSHHLPRATATTTGFMAIGDILHVTMEINKLIVPFLMETCTKMVDVFLMDPEESDVNVTLSQFTFVLRDSKKNSVC
jgi:hypothetical protein